MSNWRTLGSSHLWAFSFLPHEAQAKKKSSVEIFPPLKQPDSGGKTFMVGLAKLNISDWLSTSYDRGNITVNQRNKTVTLFHFCWALCWFSLTPCCCGYNQTRVLMISTQKQSSRSLIHHFPWGIHKGNSDFHSVPSASRPASLAV